MKAKNNNHITKGLSHPCTFFGFYIVYHISEKIFLFETKFHYTYFTQHRWLPSAFIFVFVFIKREFHCFILFYILGLSYISVNTSNFSYPVTDSWTFLLIKYLRYYKLSCQKQEGTDNFLRFLFHFLWVSSMSGLYNRYKLS